MRTRIALSAVLACGAVAVGGVAADAAPKKTFKGKTAQKRPVKIAVRGRTIDVLHFKARLKCRNGDILILDEGGFLPTRVKGNGKFRDKQFGRTDTVLIRGRLRGRVVRGKLRVFDKIGRKGIKCKSHWIKFKAKRGK